MSLRWLMRRAWRRLLRHRLTFVGIALAFGVVATLGAGARALGRQSALATAQLTGQAHIIAYLDDGLSGDQTSALVKTLARLPGVGEVRQVDGAAAASFLRKEIEALDTTPAAIDPSFLPTSVEIVMVARPDLIERVSDTAARLGRLPGIAAVDEMTAGLERVAAFTTLSRRLSILLAGMALLAALFLVAGVIGRERANQREEAETLRLLGATPAVLRLPAGVLGTLAAAAGGLCGVFVGTRLGTLLFGVTAGALSLSPTELLFAMATLCALGLCVGWLSVPNRRALDGR